MSSPLIICAIDRPNWCFNNIANALQVHLSEHYRFKIVPATKIVNEECDVLVGLCWELILRAKGNCKARAAIPCLYDHLSWSIDAGAQAHFKLVAKNATVLGVCNEMIMQRAMEIVPPSELPPLALLEDGVDTNIFKHCKMPDKFAAGWTGMSCRHTPGGPEDLKGYGIIQEACALAGAELRILDAANGGAWPLARMPVFYEAISVGLIGSAYEGTPNPLLEAMACGRPVISTNVGLAPKIIKNGENGFIVGRDAQSMAAAIRTIQSMSKSDLAKMGEKAYLAAQVFSWKNKVKPWKAAIDLALLGHDIVRLRSAAAQGYAKGVSAAVVETIAPSAPAKTLRGNMNKPRVLLISDVRDWAFHTNMKDLEEYLSDQFTFDHWFVIEWHTDGRVPDFDQFDIVFCVYHRWAVNHLIPWHKTVGSLRALWFKPENPKPPSKEEYDLVNRCRAFHVVTQQNYDELKAHCPDVMYLTNPVNMNRFPIATTAGTVDTPVIATWNGNAKHRSAGGIDVKGFYDIVMPACGIAEVPLEFAEYNTKRLAPGDMPAFYQKGNVAICASLYEGASNSVLEAMAAGLALITTPCGNAVEMRDSQLKQFGKTGIVLVDRTPHSIAAALSELKSNPTRVKEMGTVNREEITSRWSWSVWKDAYATFLRKAL